MSNESWTIKVMVESKKLLSEEQIKEMIDRIIEEAIQKEVCRSIRPEIEKIVSAVIKERFEEIMEETKVAIGTALRGITYEQAP